jgi:hypothetical protein
MPLPFGIGKKEKSISELEEETEVLEAQNRREDQELSLLQKKVAAEKLKQSGLAPKDFSFDWKRIVKFIKEH